MLTRTAAAPGGFFTGSEATLFTVGPWPLPPNTTFSTATRSSSSSWPLDVPTPHSRPDPQADAAGGRAPERRLAVSIFGALSGRTYFRTQLLGEGAGQPQPQAIAPPTPVLTDTSRSVDAWVVSTEEVGQLAVSPGALDLTHLVRADPWVHWYRGGLLRPYELLLYRHGGRAVGLPLGISTQLLYYNQEALQRRNISVPHTWDELLHAAGTMHEQDLCGDGSTSYGICVVPEEGSVLYGGDGEQGADAALWLPVLVDVWASMAQTAGPEQGLWFSPQDLSPWVDGPAVWEALRVMAALRALAPAAMASGGEGKNSTAGSSTGQQGQQGAGSSGSDGGVTAGGSRGHLGLALQGRCAFTIAPGLSVFKAASRTSYMYGRLGAAPLPGSTRVWSPASGALQPCTGETCPYGTPGRQEGPLVNRAQVVRAPATMALSNNASNRSLGSQLAAYTLASSYLEPDRAFRDVLNPDSGGYQCDSAICRTRRPLAVAIHVELSTAFSLLAAWPWLGSAHHWIPLPGLHLTSTIVVGPSRCSLPTYPLPRQVPTRGATPTCQTRVPGCSRGTTPMTSPPY